jgi:hypothetical protein
VAVVRLDTKTRRFWQRQYWQRDGGSSLLGGASIAQYRDSPPFVAELARLLHAEFVYSNVADDLIDAATPFPRTLPISLIPFANETLNVVKRRAFQIAAFRPGIETTPTVKRNVVDRWSWRIGL